MRMVERQAARGAGGSDDRRGVRNDLAGRMGEFVRALQQEQDETGILEHLVEAAVEMIPGAEEASISLVLARQRVDPRVPSGRMARDVDALQNRVAQGPCLDAAYEHQVVRVPDMSTERRWPRFAGEAHALGAASMLSIRLFVEGEKLGAMNLFSRSAHAFDTDSEEIAMLIAAHAAVVLAETQHSEQLRVAAVSRDVIGQAKGILMERYKITDAQAFLLLVEASSRSNIKLFRVAEHLATTGVLPNSDDSTGEN